MKSPIIAYRTKEIIFRALLKRRDNYTSDKACAIAYNLPPAIYSRLKRGEFNTLSDANWITLARKLEVALKAETPWKTTETKTFKIITTQLKMCQERSMSAILVDFAGVGKTHAAKHYAKSNPFVTYIDCSQVKTKRNLIKEIARQFGIQTGVRYDAMYADLIFYINSIQNPLIILDEAGDLKYEAFLELKALWNACERTCGWYMMGADGLKKKMERMRENGKVGYAEIFDRFGKKYQKITPNNAEELKEFNMKQAAQIIAANAPRADVQKMVAKTDGSLRRIYLEIQKGQRP